MFSGGLFWVLFERCMFDGRIKKEHAEMFKAALKLGDDPVIHATCRGKRVMSSVWTPSHVWLVEILADHARLPRQTVMSSVWSSHAWLVEILADHARLPRKTVMSVFGARMHGWWRYWRSCEITS